MSISTDSSERFKRLICTADLVAILLRYRGESKTKEDLEILSVCPLDIL
jgi:hypothetical protein